MENLDIAEWIGLAVILIAAFFILAFITRWIFSIGKQLKYQEVIIKLLIKVASGETLTIDEKNSINKEVNQVKTGVEPQYQKDTLGTA